MYGFQMWAETKGRQPSRQSNHKMMFALRSNIDKVYTQLCQTNPWFKKFLKLEISQRGDLDYGTDLNPIGYGLRSDNLGYVNRNGKYTVVILDSGFIKPFDTRKLKAKYDIDSPQINDDFDE